MGDLEGVGEKNPLTYLAYDIMSGTLLTEMPLTGVTFSQRLNGIGSLSGKLDYLDPEVQSWGPGATLQPGRTAVFVDYLGQLLWGGPLWTANFQRSTASATPLGCQEWWSYFQQRVQAYDYETAPFGDGTFWLAQNPDDPMDIAAQVVHDAIGVGGSAMGHSASGVGFTLQINVNNQTAPFGGNGGQTPFQNWVIGNFPITSLQSIDSILTSLSNMGYGVGFDWDITMAYGNGVINGGPQGCALGLPCLVLNLWYPRSGRIADLDSVVIVTQSSQDYTYPQDATQMANTVYATGAGGGQVQDSGSNAQSITDGFPLLEAVQSYSAITSIGQLISAIQGDLQQQSFPVTTPTVTIPMFGDPAPLQYNIGDDVRWIIEPDERFPDGLDFYWRIVAIDYSPADVGLSTAKLTLNLPIGSGVQYPPT